jgi:hypothetical protein
VRGGIDACQELRFGYERRELRGDGHQHACFVVGKGSARRGLRHENALQQSALDDRHAEERVVFVFSRVGEIFEARMLERVRHVHRREAFGDETGQPFVDRHPQPADAVGIEPDGGTQHEFSAFRLVEINGADVRFAAFLDQPHDVGERFSRVVAVGQQLTDFLQSEEQRIVVSRRHSASPPPCRDVSLT